jgi:RNA polymerase sigma-70 factor, ECF subfamily
VPSMQRGAISSASTKQLEAEPEAKLIAWIASGDEAAFRMFYDATNGLIFGLLLRILGHTQTAEEVLKELYEEVRQTAARFGKQNERPLTWLIFIAHRRAIECLCRRLTVQSHFSQPVINITEQRRLIRSAMASIPYTEQRMVEMAFFSGMTNREIANELELTPEAVEAHVRHAMLRLFRLFSAIGFSPARPTETRATLGPSQGPAD